MTELADRRIVVIADDEEKNRIFLRPVVERAGFLVVEAEDAGSAIEAIDQHAATGQLLAVITDLKMPGAKGGRLGGWDVIVHAYELSKSIRLALFTGQMESDLRAIFKSKSVIPSFSVIIKTEEEDRLVKWVSDLRSAWENSLGLAMRDASTRQIYDHLAPTYAASSLPILIVGESGTGKEGLARHLHNTSGRGEYRFVALNSGGLEPSLAFTDLFGQAAGALADARQHELGKMLEASGYRPGPRFGDRDPMPFIDWLKAGNPDLELKDGLWISHEAEASAGTLFLDEVATFSGKVAAGMLRVLETADIIPMGHHGPSIRSYCRVIAATNEVEAVAGTGTQTTFRRDLFYRLAGAVLSLRPLRERDADDIRDYVRDIAWAQLGVSKTPASKAAVEFVVNLFQDRDDPVAVQYQRGNFRSLRNMVHRASLIARADSSDSIELDHMQMAATHGQIEVTSAGTTNQYEHVRRVFRTELHTRHVTIRDDFSRNDLKELARNNPIETACAILRCSTLEREDGKYYELGQIEVALMLGKTFSRGNWIYKDIKAEHAKAAAERYLGFTFEKDSKQEFGDVIRLVRSKPG